MSNDRVSVAVIQGISAAVLLLLFLVAALPEHRTSVGMLYFSVTSLLLGVMIYFRRRATAYLIAKPSVWSTFQPIRLLNPGRYHTHGRKFVLMQLAAFVALVAWWIIGGAVLSG